MGNSNVGKVEHLNVFVVGNLASCESGVLFKDGSMAPPLYAAKETDEAPDAVLALVAVNQNR